MIRKHLQALSRYGSKYFSHSFDMEASRLTQHLNQIVEALYDFQNEVRSFGEDSQARKQGLAYKVQLVLEWHESVAVSLGLLPPFFLEGLCLYVSIHNPSGLEEEIDATPWIERSDRVVSLQDSLGLSSQWKQQAARDVAPPGKSPPSHVDIVHLGQRS